MKHFLFNSTIVTVVIEWVVERVEERVENRVAVVMMMIIAPAIFFTRFLVRLVVFVPILVFVVMFVFFIILIVFIVIVVALVVVVIVPVALFRRRRGPVMMIAVFVRAGIDHVVVLKMALEDVSEWLGVVPIRERVGAQIRKLKSCRKTRFWPIFNVFCKKFCR